MTTTAVQPLTSFQTHPERYSHWRLGINGPIATLTMAVDPLRGEREDYELKLNSYDLAVDIELADAVQRIRFEHPEVRCVVLTGALDKVFCAGANIVMLRTSTHGFKVNFCKFTNETRLAIEDASEHSGLRFLAALNGTASGGGYELALACDKILLVDDRNSAVSFPEVPLLGVLPGTGGLTRIVDKRKVRRDRADLFSTLAEGLKGKRALEWGFVDALAPLSKWEEAVAAQAQELARTAAARQGKGLVLEPIACDEEENLWRYGLLEVRFDWSLRTAEISLRTGDDVPRTEAAALERGSRWWVLQAFRELDDALLRLRFHAPDIGLVCLRAFGEPQDVLETDRILAGSSHWLIQETRHLVKRVLKRLENSAKSFYAVADEGTCFVGTLLELALAADRVYALSDADPPVQLGVSDANAGLYPMGNGLSRLQTRFLGTPPQVDAVLARRSIEGGLFDVPTAEELGLCSLAADSIDWQDELRLAVEERAAFSPDAMTGMEANLRFAGPETLETKIFGRLSAWQNWIFQRPNAVGERGALQCYGTPRSPEFNPTRT